MKINKIDKSLLTFLPKKIALTCIYIYIYFCFWQDEKHEATVKEEAAEPNYRMIDGQTNKKRITNIIVFHLYF